MPGTNLGVDLPLCAWLDRIQILDRRGHLCRFKVRGKHADKIVASLCETEVALDEESDKMDTDESDRGGSVDAAHSVKVCSEKNRIALLSAATKRSKTVSSAKSEDGERIFSVALSDPRSATYDSKSFKPGNNVAGEDFSLLNEPPLSAVGRVGVDDIVSPLTGDSLSGLGKHAEEPDPAFILKELSAVLSWTLKTDPDATTYPYKYAGADKVKTANLAMNSVYDGSKQIEPTSWLWSLTLREKLANSFRKDHELNADVLRKRRAASKQLSSGQPVVMRCASASSSKSLLHLLVIRKPALFSNGIGWDLVCCPSMAPALLKALVFRGAMAIGTDEDSAISTVLHVAK